ncbi:CopD family protein [Mycobacterium sp. NPDC003449]
MGPATAVIVRRLVLGCAVIVAAGSAAAWALAYPQSPIGGTVVRAVADCAAVGAIGLAAVPLLDDARHRDELTRTAAGPLALTGTVWLLAEVVRLIVAAAQAAAVPVMHVGVHTVAEFTTRTTPGRAGLVGIVAALAVAVVALAGLRRPPRTVAPTIATVGVAAAGVAARTLSGHLSESPVGGMAVAVHALAAALWCGVLAALVLTVSHRGRWARVLPRFSQMSVGCVTVLLLGGCIGAIFRLTSPADLWGTGYGRLLAAKIAVTAGLLVLARRNRAGWLPAARAHRASAGLSQNRSLTELAVMAVALTFAAALAVAG